jgi:hypothetical protein
LLKKCRSFAKENVSHFIFQIGFTFESLIAGMIFLCLPGSKKESKMKSVSQSAIAQTGK